MEFIQDNWKNILLVVLIIVIIAMAFVGLSGTIKQPTYLFADYVEPSGDTLNASRSACSSVGRFYITGEKGICYPPNTYIYYNPPQCDLNLAGNYKIYDTLENARGLKLPLIYNLVINLEHKKDNWDNISMLMSYKNKQASINFEYNSTSEVQDENGLPTKKSSIIFVNKSAQPENFDNNELFFNVSANEEFDVTKIYIKNIKWIQGSKFVYLGFDIVSNSKPDTLFIALERLTQPMEVIVDIPQSNEVVDTDIPTAGNSDIVNTTGIPIGTTTPPTTQPATV